MPGLDFLDLKHELYSEHEAEFRREERRHEGGEAILSELVKFAHEETDSYNARQAWARWLNFAKVHTTVLAGHLTHKLPVPNYGALGEVRELGDTEGQQSLAELFHYNCDGIGNDGQSVPAFLDGVEQNAMATRFRWLLCEMPTRETLSAIRLRLGTPEVESDTERVATDEEVLAGFRPYWVEYSPLAVTNWRIREGVLLWAVIRIPVEPDMDFGEAVEGNGYYLLVRQGYRGLGDEYAGGGWWKYDAQKKEIDSGTWADTDGQIPMWLHIGKPGRGTYERPSIGQSLTMELGQISADLMNAVSEQRFNLRQAAKSVNFGLGMDPKSHTRVIEQLGDGSIFVAVPGSQNPDGTFNVPTIWNSSEGALATGAYKEVIDQAIAEAKEVMVRQILAAPDASGARVEAEHQSATVPLLAQLAGTLETSVNTGLYFTLRRFGLSHEQASAASVTIPRDFELRNVVLDIDELLGTLDKAQVQSPTWKRYLAQRKGEKLDLLPAEEREQIEAEMETEATLKQTLETAKLRAEALSALINAGAEGQAAAAELGYTPEQASRLFGGEIEQPAVVGGGAPPPSEAIRDEAATGTDGAPPPRPSLSLVRQAPPPTSLEAPVETDVEVVSEADDTAQAIREAIERMAEQFAALTQQLVSLTRTEPITVNVAPPAVTVTSPTVNVTPQPLTVLVEAPAPGTGRRRIEVTKTADGDMIGRITPEERSA